MSSSPRSRCEVPPDGGWGWVVVCASFMIHVFADGVIFSFGVFHHELVQYFEGSEAATSLIASILVGFTLCVGPVASILVNKYGCRIVAAGGGMTGAFGIIISSFAKDINSLQVTIGIITGAGLGMIYLPATVAVTSYFRRKRSLATGIAVCGSGIGTFVMAPITQWLISEYGWRGAMAISGALALNCGVFGLLFRPLQLSHKSKCRALSVQQEHAKYIEEKQRSHSLCADLTGCPRTLAVRPAPITDKKVEFNSLFLMSKTGEFVGGSTDYMLQDNKLRSLTEEIPAEKQFLVGSSRQNNVCRRESICRMLDFSLFKNPIFLIFAVSNFCTSLGFNVPFVYIVSQAKAKGIPERSGSYLISVIGIANTSGRIILGYIFDKKYVNRLWIYNICLIIGGISTCMSTLCTSMSSFVLCAVIFGFTVGAYTGLTSVILVDLLGLDKLTSVFGLLLLFQGVANFLGPPITGWLFDSTKSYMPGFLVAGATICLSGLILFTLPSVQKLIETKNKSVIAVPV